MYTHILGKQSPGVGQCTQVSVFNILFYMYTYIMIKILSFVMISIVEKINIVGQLKSN